MQELSKTFPTITIWCDRGGGGGGGGGHIVTIHVCAISVHMFDCSFIAKH